MYKSKSKAMQRGVNKRGNSKKPGEGEEYQKHPPIMAKSERMHFGVDSDSRKVFIERMRPKIRLLAKSGFRKPADVSKVLNKQKVYTEIGEKWSPRLVWFLLKFLYQDNTK